MRSINSFSGARIPVSDQFMGIHIDPHPRIDEASYATIRLVQLNLSNVATTRAESQKFGGYPIDQPLLTRAERDLLRACDAILNVNATAVALRGRDPKEVYGEEIGYDLLKFTDWVPDTCSCKHQFMWRRDHEGKDRVHHPHLTINRCEAHSQLTDHAEHHAELLAENIHSNLTREIVAGHLGVPQADITKSYNNKRELILTHSSLAPEHHEIIQAKLGKSPHITRITHLAQG